MERCIYYIVTISTKRRKEIMEKLKDALQRIKVTGIRFRTYHIVRGETELGRATMAKVIIPETGDAVISFAFCSPKDKYCKVKGQLIACGRLARVGKRRTLNNPSPENIKKLLVAEAEYRRIKWLEGITVDDLR